MIVTLHHWHCRKTKKIKAAWFVYYSMDPSRFEKNCENSAEKSIQLLKFNDFHTIGAEYFNHCTLFCCSSLVLCYSLLLLSVSLVSLYLSLFLSVSLSLSISVSLSVSVSLYCPTHTHTSVCLSVSLSLYCLTHTHSHLSLSLSHSLTHSLTHSRTHARTHARTHTGTMGARFVTISLVTKRAVVTKRSATRPLGCIISSRSWISFCSPIAPREQNETKRREKEILKKKIRSWGAPPAHNRERIPAQY